MINQCIWKIILSKIRVIIYLGINELSFRKKKYDKLLMQFLSFKLKGI